MQVSQEARSFFGKLITLGKPVITLGKPVALTNKFFLTHFAFLAL